LSSKQSLAANSVVIARCYTVAIARPVHGFDLADGLVVHLVKDRENAALFLSLWQCNGLSVAVFAVVGQ
jgi:hypothetical protein